MSRYELIRTSAEVVAVIRAKHGDDLVVFGTISEPDGDPWGESSRCQMMTEYGFLESGIPLIRLEHTWTKHPVDERKRDNEKHKYWLCVPRDCDDD